MNDKLRTIQTDEKSFKPKGASPLNEAKLKAEASYERIWLTKENQSKTALQEKIEDEAVKLIQKRAKIEGSKIALLGCGSGDLALRLAELGADVDAVDIASNALKKIPPNPRVHPIKDFVPNTSLKDSSYDIVIAEDLITKLSPNLYRLFFSELARLVKPSGIVACGSLLDYKTEEPLEAFLSLAETELDVIECGVSYDRLFLSASNLFNKLPSSFQKIINNKKAVAYFSTLTKFFFDQSGISYAFLIGKRKSLMQNKIEGSAPIERPLKKSVWE